MKWIIEEDRTFTDSEEAAAYMLILLNENSDGIIDGYDKDMFLMEMAYTLDRMDDGATIEIETIRAEYHAA